MAIDIDVSPNGYREFEEAIESIREHPFRDEEQIDRFEVNENTFERRVETDNVEEFFQELKNVPLELSSGIGGKGTVAEFRLRPDAEDYENMRKMVTALEEAGANIDSIWFTSNNGLGRGPRGDLGSADIPSYLDSFENAQHEIIIDAEMNGSRTAVKYNTDGYAVIEEGMLLSPERRKFNEPDRGLGFPFSEKLRDKGVPLEWRKGAKQNLEYVESRVEYLDGTVSPEGEPTPIPTSISGNDYETGTRTYIVDGEERTGTIMAEEKEDQDLEDIADRQLSGGIGG